MNGRPSTVNLNTTPLRPATVVDDVSRGVDELLRRTLRIGDPNNPGELADALRRHYSAQAARLDQESLGLPVSPGATFDLMIRAESPKNGASPIERENERLGSALEADLDVLINHAANRDWRPELQGWRASILRELADAWAAASHSQDPAQRDRAMLGVRKLAEFARMSRLLSVLHYELRRAYRRLATTLDESSNMLRTGIGQSLYSAGLSEGGLLLNVPLLDLRGRSSALIEALRALIEGNSTQQVGIEDRGNRFIAYREVLKDIEDQGAAELRVYMRESSLQQHLDSILDGVGSASNRISADGLRNLAATLPAEISRIQRLYELVGGVVVRVTPYNSTLYIAELSRFHQALGLFVHALISMRSGERLVDLAVPLAMHSRQAKQGDEGRDRLRKLVTWRAQFARLAETRIASDENTLNNRQLQARIDRVLFDFDRAIDLYALGSGSKGQWGQQEIHAVSVAAIFEHLVQMQKLTANDSMAAIAAEAAALLRKDVDISQDILDKLREQQATTEAHWHAITRKQAPLSSDPEVIRQACLDLIRGGTRRPRDPEWPVPPDVTLLGQPDDRARRSVPDMDVPTNRFTPIATTWEIRQLDAERRTAFCFINTAILALADLQFALKDPNQQVMKRWDDWKALLNPPSDGPTLAGPQSTGTSSTLPKWIEPQGLPGFVPWSKVAKTAMPEEVATYITSFLNWVPGSATEQEIYLWTTRLTYCLLLLCQVHGNPLAGSVSDNQVPPQVSPTTQTPPGKAGGTATSKNG